MTNDEYDPWEDIVEALLDSLDIPLTPDEERALDILLQSPVVRILTEVDGGE